MQHNQRNWRIPYNVPRAVLHGKSKSASLVCHSYHQAHAPFYVNALQGISTAFTISVPYSEHVNAAISNYLHTCALMWAMVMLASAPSPLPLTHRDTDTAFTVWQGLSSQTSWVSGLDSCPPIAQSQSLSVCVCVYVCSVNRPAPRLLSRLGRFVNCHAHVTRPSSVQVAKCPSGQVAIHIFITTILCFIFALSLSLIKFQFVLLLRVAAVKRKRLLYINAC